jgi:hypothetical protein
MLARQAPPQACPFEEVNLTTGGGGQQEGGALSDRTISEKRVPFLFVDGRGVGGLEEMVWPSTLVGC